MDQIRDKFFDYARNQRCRSAAQIVGPEEVGLVGLLCIPDTTSNTPIRARLELFFPIRRRMAAGIICRGCSTSCAERAGDGTPPARYFQRALLPAGRHLR
jgi:hypothetical protein